MPADSRIRPFAWSISSPDDSLQQKTFEKDSSLAISANRPWVYTGQGSFLSLVITITTNAITTPMSTMRIIVAPNMEWFR